MALFHTSLLFRWEKHQRSLLFLWPILLSLFLFLISPGGAEALEISLGWNPNQEADVVGYKLYFGNATRDYTGSIDVGNVTKYRLSGLDEGKTYFFATTAYDRSGSESEFSTEVSYPQVSDTTQGAASAAGASSGTGGGGGGCFIATAIYGPESREVFVLRQFRDQHLITNRTGRRFVSLYYRFSPPVARTIEGSIILRTLGRSIIAPVVYAIEHVYVLLSIICMAVLLVLKRKAGRESA